MPGKPCERCNAPFKGYGAVCSACRRLPAPEWGHCSECGVYFKGYKGVCQECSLKSSGGEIPADNAGEDLVPCHPACAEASCPHPVRRRAISEVNQVASIAQVECGASKQAMMCAACNEPLGALPFISSEGQTFHRKCLVCSGCQAPLDGTHTLAREGLRLCLSCAPSCNSCRKPVVGQVTKADGKHYHPDCFKCDGCSRKLMGNFRTQNGKNMCQVCSQRPQEPPSNFNQARAKFLRQLESIDEGPGAGVRDRCSGCREPLGVEVVRVEGKCFHPACFKCYKLEGADKTRPACSKCRSLISGRFRNTDEGPVCAACGPSLQCAGCQQPLAGQITQVGEKAYHPGCFSCRACGGTLADGFCSVDGDCLCEGCAKKRRERKLAQARGPCAKCSDPISGRCVDAGNGDRFHASCFTCDGCSKGLDAFCAAESQGRRRYLCEACV